MASDDDDSLMDDSGSMQDEEDEEYSDDYSDGGHLEAGPSTQAAATPGFHVLNQGAYCCANQIHRCGLCGRSRAAPPAETQALSLLCTCARPQTPSLGCRRVCGVCTSRAELEDSALPTAAPASVPFTAALSMKQYAQLGHARV
jgi:hypothetical protein